MCGNCAGEFAVAVGGVVFESNILALTWYVCRFAPTSSKPSPRAENWPSFRESWLNFLFCMD